VLRRRCGSVWALATAALVASAALVAFPAHAQITGPLIPPSLPSSPQPVFPRLPSIPSTPSSSPPGAPPPSPPGQGAPPGPPAITPGNSATPAVSARTQRVTVVSLDRRPEGVFLVARDESGNDLVFALAGYTSVLGADASRIEVDHLRPADQIEVTWFPEGARRTLLAIRKVP